MFSVTSDTASIVSSRNTPSKTARDDQASASDSFDAMVAVKTSTADSSQSRPAALLPEQPAPPARNDDRATRADDTSRSDDRATAAAARDGRDQDTKIANDRADAARDSNAPKANDKTSDKADAKTDATTGKDTKTDKDSAAKDTKPIETNSTDTAKTQTAVPATAVAVVIPVAAAATAEVTAPAATANAGATQPAAIAAAVLKAQVAATEAGTATDAQTAIAAPATAASTDQDFAALIASATPAAAKTGVKSGIKQDGNAAEAASTDAADTAPATTGQPAADIHPVAGNKPGEVRSETAKPDAGATEATGNTDPNAKPAHAAHDRPGADAATTTLAPVDLTAAASALQAQPLQATAPAAVTAQQLTATVATNAPVPLNGLAVEIAQSAQSGKSRFDIRLDPAELGRIDVRLDVDRHGNVTSHLTVEKAETLAMLRQDAPQLQRALEQAGLKTDGSGLQFSLRDQSSSGQQNSGDNSGRQSQRLIVSEDDSMPAVAAGRNYGRMLGSSRGVDISI